MDRFIVERPRYDTADASDATSSAQSENMQPSTSAER